MTSSTRLPGFQAHFAPGSGPENLSRRIHPSGRARHAAAMRLNHRDVASLLF
jgi:hypothetical protein